MPTHLAPPRPSPATPPADTAKRPSRVRASVAGRIAGPVIAAILGGASLLAAAPAAAQSKIAVVDVQRAVLDTEEGLRVQANLKKLFDSRQVELDGKQRALQADREALDKEAQAGKTPKDVLQKKFEAWQKQYAELQSTTLEYQREMQRKEHEMTTPILTRILGLVRRIAAQEGYEMVLEKSAVPYFRTDLEITDRAIQMFNSGQTGDTPAAGAPAGKPGAPTAPATAPAPAQPPAAKPAPKPAPAGTK
jgi:outer membrane protein